ncbi:MAG TPA: hypothetical protein PLA01_09920 [Acetivibrio sp.]|nr:hypothetical protein [Acetivibrio sp.]
MAVCILMLRMLFRGRGDLMVERFYALCQGFSCPWQRALCL